MKNLYKIEDELYIVSNNEDISENCWIITSGKLVQVSYLLSDEVAKGFKVILTTNKLLIKDGVQAIDDEFLEWFVKNPSCEEVEVDFKYENCIPALDDNGNKILKIKIPSKSENLRQIIPKEEPKQREVFLMNANETVDTRSIVEKMKPLQEQWQKDMEESLNTKQKSILKCELCERYPRLEGTNKCESCYSVIRHFLEQAPELKEHLLPDLRKKEETLKEATNRLYNENKFETDTPFESGTFKLGVELGAKWQEERSYSEEEVLKIIQDCKSYLSFGDEFDEIEWFTQFKKK